MLWFFGGIFLFPAILMPINVSWAQYDGSAMGLRMWGFAASPSATASPLDTPECGAGWTLLGGFCYKLMAPRVSYSTARTDCISQGSDSSLLYITSHAETMALKGKVLRTVRQDRAPHLTNSNWQFALAKERNYPRFRHLSEGFFWKEHYTHAKSINLLYCPAVFGHFSPAP